MTLTKYATLSFVTMLLLLVFGINSGTFAQSSKNSDKPTIKTAKNNINGISSSNKFSRKNINIRTQTKESAGRPDDGFATDSNSVDVRSDSGIVRARIVRLTHFREKDQLIKTKSRNDGEVRISSAGLRTRLVSSGKANKTTKDLRNNKAEAKRTENEVKLKTNARQKS